MFYESKIMFRNFVTTCDNVNAEVNKRSKLINKEVQILATFQSTVIELKVKSFNEFK